MFRAKTQRALGLEVSQRPQRIGVFQRDQEMLSMMAFRVALGRMAALVLA